MPVPAVATSLPRPERPHPTPLGELARLVGAQLTPPTDDSIPVSGVTATSGDVRPGDLFAALPGRLRHGLDYLEDALARGAVAVFTDAAGAAAVAGRVPVLLAAQPRERLPEIAAHVYGYPARRLRVIGITGTSGKTTTSFLVRAGLAAAGHASGLLGTVGTFVGAREIPAALTTPEAPQLQALLALIAEQGIDYAVMEVSSHALALHRADHIEFAVAAFTNLSQDHLDFHPSMSDYFEAKARLFDGRAARAVVMVDDEWGRALADRIGPAATTVRTGPGPATWTLSDAATEPDGSTSFTAHGPGVQVGCGSRIPGDYNDSNALLALAILAELGVDLDVAAGAVQAAQVPGRMERVDAGQPFLAVVDYAHKPAAVEGALRALRPLTAGRLIIVLGCGGDRDRGKRPQMGAVAAGGADVLFVTDDNPRSEDPAAIRAAVLAGARAVETGADIVEIGDRAGAIHAAVALAGPADTVVIAGKGHESGQEIAGTVYPFDDRRVLRAALLGTAAHS